MTDEELQDTPVSFSARPGRSGRQVYLAGPFTDVAQRRSPADGMAPGIIGPESPWRQILEATERALAGRGWGVFLPHRDVSRWGHRETSPGRIARECLEAVLNSDCIIAVMAESFGTHVEVGTAIGRGIPTIVVETGDEKISFFARAVGGCDLVTSVQLDNLRDLPAIVAGDGFDEAVRRAFRQRPDRNLHSNGRSPNRTGGL